jgi:hypothetical protein
VCPVGGQSKTFAKTDKSTHREGVGMSVCRTGCRRRGTQVHPAPLQLIYSEENMWMTGSDLGKFVKKIRTTCLMFYWPCITVYQCSDWPCITVYQCSDWPCITVYQYSDWPCITVYQCSETNVTHVLFNLLRIKGLYMFGALLAHPQEVFHKRYLV